MSIVKNLATKQYVSIEEFSSIMSSLYLNGDLHIAVAVSGGSDSLCLALLLKLWSISNKAKITAIIVNHNLRENINEEIEQVTKWLQQYNINTVILTINTINKCSKLQQNARKERYRVLLKYCEENNIAYLAIAHHFNDLIETVLMRKKRGTSVWGNSGISLVKNFKKVLIFRPLLFFSKQALQNTLINLNQDWVNDPSNKNMRFERVLIREQLGQLDNLQINYYSNLINNFRVHRMNLEQYCLEYLVNECNISRFGEVTVSLSSFLKLEFKVQLAVIRIIIKFISNKEYMPKILKVQALIKFLKQVVNKHKKYALGGVLIEINNIPKYNNQDNLCIKFLKEARGILEKTKIMDLYTNSFVWDNRFLINNMKNFPKNYFFANLNIKEYNYLYKISKVKEFIQKDLLTKEVILSLPWLFNDLNKPIIDWVNNLLNENNVKFSPTNSLLNNIFSHLTIANMYY